MAANPLLRQMDPTQEWFDFDNSFESPLGDLDNDLTLVDSISPTDAALMYPNVNDFNADSTSGFCSEPWFSDFVSYEALDTGALDNLKPFPDADYTLNAAVMPNPEAMVPSFNCDGSKDSWQHKMPSIRQVVEAQAAADPRCSSKKEKRIEASIAIHMQRLQEGSITSLDMLDDTSFSSPGSSDLVQDDVSPASTRASQTATPASTTDNTPTPNSSGTDQTAAGVELVLDMNMNATTNLPKKHKPRSQAQKDNYIKVRKHGACEKHRKQHKRCNCLNKNASRINVTGLDPTSPMTVQPPRQTPLHVRSPQYKQSMVQSRDISKSDLLNSRATVLPIPGQNTDKQLYSPASRRPDASQSMSLLPNQYSTPSFGHSAHSKIPGEDKQIRLQVRPQTDPASSKRAVNPAACTQPLRPGERSIPSCPGSRPTQQQTSGSIQPTRRTYYVSKVSPAVESYFNCNAQPGHNKIQPTRSGIEVRPPSTAATHGAVQNRGNKGHAPKFLLTEQAGQFMRSTLLSAYSSFSPVPSAIISRTGSFFGNTFMACFKRCWSAKKSLGLYGFSALV